MLRLTIRYALHSYSSFIKAPLLLHLQREGCGVHHSLFLGLRPYRPSMAFNPIIDLVLSFTVVSFLSRYYALTPPITY
uniref:Uncharacterized protein n=1 Tax=Picea glauca TaxID=3330 RepID=A0A101LW40_PICGL|nr:hypothetical protein ABT39_MTgene1520 [Picea glauca]QHR88242.1 hypothetical protein Q903MT_gene2255 [Picea sitchensis]